MSGESETTRSRPLRRRNVMGSTGRFGPNMTPMVDVVLVILIFFMAATTIAGQEWFLHADLPESREQDQASLEFDLPTPMLDVTLYVQDGVVLVRGLGDSPRGLSELIEQIQGMDPAASEGLILRIASSDDVPYGSVIALHDAGTAQGMRVALR